MAHAACCATRMRVGVATMGERRSPYGHQGKAGSSVGRHRGAKRSSVPPPPLSGPGTRAAAHPATEGSGYAGATLRFRIAQVDAHGRPYQRRPYQMLAHTKRALI